jgi:CSLREA domain-containing protein
LHQVKLLVAVLGVLSLARSGAVLAGTFNVTKVVDTNDGACDDDCSLREAMIAANAHPGPDTVIVPAGTYVLTLIGSGKDAAATGDLDILDDLTITGVGPASTVIDGNQTDRVFQVQGAVVVRMSGLTIQKGMESYGGGVANGNTAMLTLDNCTLSDNSASSGGGIVNWGTATLTLHNCTLSGNSAGGGIFAGGATWPTVSPAAIVPAIPAFL